MSQESDFGINVLVIEDEIAISDLICYSLKREGMKVEAEYTGKSGLERLGQNYVPDLVILDLMLPDISGFDVCSEITTKYAIPVIILTAKSGLLDKLKGLDIGADDYILKPFDVLELSARVRTVLRRVKRCASQDIIYITPSITIKSSERKVVKNGEYVELTPKEFELLVFLTNNRGQVFTREILLDSVWGYNFIGGTRTIDIHIRRLRMKLDDRSGVSLIETVFGVGYMIPKSYFSKKS